MDDFAARAAARWRAIDPLLPDPVPAEPGPDCGARLAVGAGGKLAAFGACCHVTPDPAGIDLSWGMARRFELGGPPSPHPALCRRCCRPSRVQPGNRTKKTFRLFTFPEMITISMH
jgi:hypothetical protein